MVLALLALLQRADPVEALQAPVQEEAAEAAQQALEEGRFLWIRGGLGTFRAQSDPQLPGQRDPRGVTLSLGVEWPHLPFFSFDLEMVSAQRKFETGGGSFFIISVDDETSIASTAITVGGRLRLPPGGPVRAYASLGVGYVHTTFQTEGSFLGLPGTVQEESDGTLAVVPGAGVEVLLGQWSIHADYRTFGASGSFPAYEIPDLEVGGRTLTVGVGYRWSPLARRDPTTES